MTKTTPLRNVEMHIHIYVCVCVVAEQEKERNDKRIFRRYIYVCI